MFIMGHAECCFFFKSVLIEKISDKFTFDLCLSSKFYVNNGETPNAESFFFNLRFDKLKKKSIYHNPIPPYINANENW